ncbi:MAG TPA: GNAT family N-acetyltransferase [Conexibacter sp.]|jgi:GNAT superfamily N-acetyltransferase|nr:GNAT family N-acetyltransferase [Conexibacter sp.]
MAAAPHLRSATRDDVPLLLELIGELADYERLRDELVADAALIERHLFGERPVAEAVLAEADGEALGYALFFPTFSTFVGRPGIWLEDLFVRPQHRGAGVGRALLAHVARLAVARGCGRLEWSALDWNEPALAFYRGLGARRMVEWQMHRLDGRALATFAGETGDLRGASAGDTA